MTGADSLPSPSMDNFLDVLANRYRRRVLIALLEHNPQDDNDPQIPDDVTLETDALDSLMINMRHTHLPKLEEAGFIEWDREANTIKQGPQFEEVQPLLELMANHADELPDDWL